MLNQSFSNQISICQSQFFQTGKEDNKFENFHHTSRLLQNYSLDNTYIVVRKLSTIKFCSSGGSMKEKYEFSKKFEVFKTITDHVVVSTF